MTDKKDLLHRFIFENIPIRGEYTYLRESYQTIVEQHQYPAPIKKLLGEALCIASLLSAVIKFSGRLTVQFRGKGKLKLLLAQCTNEFHLRGLVKWQGDLNYEDLMTSFNDGVLVVMLDMGLGNRYQGIVEWRGNSLVESIEGYFKESEQLPTKIWLKVTEEAVSGLLLQITPGVEDKIQSEHDAHVHQDWDQLLRLTSLMNPDDLLTMDYEALLRQLYPDQAIRVFNPISLTFQCTCTRKRGEDAISLLGREEAEDELKNKQSIVVTCDFCNKEYVYDRNDVENIFVKKDIPPSESSLH